MNSSSLTITDTGCTAEQENNTNANSSVLREVITLAVMFLVTSAVSLLLTLTWVL